MVTSGVQAVAGGVKMIAKKCDRCGVYYDTYNVKRNRGNVNGIMFLNIDERGDYFGHKAIDLCPECMKAVKNFVQGVGK